MEHGQGRLPRAKSCNTSSGATEKSLRRAKRAPLPPRDFCCPMAPFSELSPPPPRLFAEAATAAGSPPMASGIAAFMPRTAPICGSSCAAALAVPAHRGHPPTPMPTPRLLASSRKLGAAARIAAPKNGPREAGARRLLGLKSCAAIRTWRCTRGAAELLDYELLVAGPRSTRACTILEMESRVTTPTTLSPRTTAS